MAKVTKLTKKNDPLDSQLEDTYSLLRRIAQHQLERNRGLSISATELVHELYLKLEKNPDLSVHDRGHFVSIASQCMRWLLADYAKRKKRGKRGGGGIRIEFDEQIHGKHTDVDVIELVSVLQRLREIAPRAAEIAELRYILGLTLSETAVALQISEATAKRDLVFAKTWLTKELFIMEAKKTA